jgi:hypothetical protein
MRLKNNQELFDYLVRLASTLAARGQLELSRAVLAASHTAATIPITEFLGESRIALRQVEKEKLALSADEQSDLLDVLRQLDEAFSRH